MCYTQVNKGVNAMRKSLLVLSILAIALGISSQKAAAVLPITSDTKYLVSYSVNGNFYQNGGTYPRISSDGTKTSFFSSLSLSGIEQLYSTQPTIQADGIFLRGDTTSSLTHMLNLSPDGSYIERNGNSPYFLNGEGSAAVFTGTVIGPLQNQRGAIFKKDLTDGSLTRIYPQTVTDDINATIVAASNNLRYLYLRIQFSGVSQENNQSGTYKFDTQSNTLTQVPLNGADEIEVLDASSDGRYIAVIKIKEVIEEVDGVTTRYNSQVGYVYDSDTNQEFLVTKNDDGSELQTQYLSITGDGMKTVYKASPSGSNRGIYIYDRGTNTTTLLTTTFNGGGLDNGDVFNPRISDNGKVLTFISTANNIVQGDNGVLDAFAKNLQSGITRRLSDGIPQFAGGANEYAAGDNIDTSSDGRYAVFTKPETTIYGNKSMQVWRYDLEDYLQPLTVPTGLTAATPSRGIHLQWNASPGANRYNIYQNGSKIATVQDTKYDVDNTGVNGLTYDYQVSAIQDETESAKTPSTSVLIDRSQPNVQYSLNGTAGVDNWFRSDVQVIFTCYDQLSSIAFCSPPALLSTEGAAVSTPWTATDTAGNTLSGLAYAKIDKTLPVANNLVASPLVLKNGEIMNFSFNSSDQLSGVYDAGWHIDGNPPNLGSLSYANGTTQGQYVPSGLTKGNHTLWVYARDKAGNISTPLSMSFRIKN